MFKHCPGVKSIVGPARIIIRTCPACGKEVEFFSDETEIKCYHCGRPTHREATPSCVSTCQYADKCIADLKHRGIISPSRAEELKRMIKKKDEVGERGDK